MLVCPYLLLLVAQVAPDASELVLAALRHNARNEAAARSYGATQETVEKRFAADGSTTQSEAKTYELIPLAGEPYLKLVRRNGQPLDSAEARKEEEKFAEAKRKRAAETPQQRKNRLANYESKLARQREMFAELPKAFKFSMEGENQEAWIVKASPRAEYKAPSMRLSFLNKMGGRIYIDKASKRMLKVDVETFAPVSFGWFLAKLGPGTRFTIEQMALPDGTWVLKRFAIRYDVKIAALKQIRGETEQRMWNYKKAAD